MYKFHLRKLVILLPCMAAMAVLWALPALAVSEADVEAAVASQGKEAVSGNLFVWFLCAIAFLKVSTKIDGILQAMGLGVGRAPGSILAEAFMALRGLQAGKAILSGQMPGAGSRSAATGAGTASAVSGGLAGMVSSKLETDIAASMSGSGGGVTSGLGTSLYKSTLGQDGGFASRVIGSVATGQTPGAIHGAAAEEAMQGYFAGTPDPAPSQGSADTAVDFSADGVGGIPSSADGTVLDDVDTDMPTDAPIPTSPLALEGDTAVPVSPGYEAEIAQTAGGTSTSYTASVGSGYCGRRAVLRDASYVYGSHVYNPEQKLYVCAGYPACNSYVGVHLGSLRPKGSLANGALRNKRILAHKAFDAVWQNGILTRKDAYRWLQDITGLDEQHAHIAMFSGYRCDQVIAACNSVLANHNRKEVA